MSIAPDLSDLIYNTGTVSINTGQDTLVGVGTSWEVSEAAPVIRSGDTFVALGYQVPIYEVTDDTHAVLSMPWPGGNLAGATYQIIKGSPYRQDNVEVAVSIRNFVQSLAGMTPIYYVTGSVPDPDIGESGQFAIKVVAGAWQLWEKVDDAWVARGSAAGQAATVAVGTTTTGAAGTNAAVVNAGTSSAAVLNFTIPRGNTGLTGATGPSYAATSVSSQVIGSTGTKTFTTQAGLAYQAGARVRATSGANWMEGVVTSYAGTTLVFTADKSSGAGTLATWTINIAGQPGADGTGVGDVTAAAPFGSDNRLLRSDGTGKGAQASPTIVDDNGNLTFAGTTYLYGRNAEDTVNLPVLHWNVANNWTYLFSRGDGFSLRSAANAVLFQVTDAGAWIFTNTAGARTSLGLGSVDNTSDATKNAAAATLSNKTLTAPVFSGLITGTFTLPTTATFPNTVAPATGGVINDAALPERLRITAQTIVDWDTAIHNGWYMGSNATNAPATGWFLGNVEAHGGAGWVTQTVHDFSTDSASDTKAWRREFNNGIWGAWYRIRFSEAELDARYAAIATAVTLAGPQSLSNKTLAAPIFSGSITGTYTLAGTPTFPATVVLTTGAQTLANKTLTAPVINSPTGITAANVGLGSVPNYAAATTAQYRANTANLLLTTDQVWASGAEVAITYAASVAPNMATFINAAITMTGNLTLANPTNPTPGQTGVIRLVHSGAARTISYGTNWKFAGGTAPAASIVSGAEDLLFYHVISATRIMATLVKGVP